MMLAYLNHGSLNGAVVLQPESVSLLTDTAPIDGRGLGWGIGRFGDAFYLEHAGIGPGFATSLHLYLEKGIGFTILSNGTDLDRDGLMELFAKLEW